ncbi:MAG: hypothetical protein Q9223_004986 [Gallowayella weberi]
MHLSSLLLLTTATHSLTTLAAFPVSTRDSGLYLTVYDKRDCKGHWMTFPHVWYDWDYTFSPKASFQLNRDVIDKEERLTFNIVGKPNTNDGLMELGKAPTYL